ncbi:MAG: FAD-dependent monooxygenase, partial [Candidatus Eremiobacteraeota bacterium]|nr:FAD-dependent monooxygenase [Candidatus Eremiobacteraeota bacterium]
MSSLIVGAGPVGLTLALLLQRYRVPFRIIEKRSQAVIQTKAAGLWSRSLEVLEHLDLAQNFMEAAHRSDHGNIFVQGRRALRLDLTELPTRYNFLTLIAQHRTEALLAEALAQRGDPVERGVELTAWDGKTAHLETAEGT